MKGIRYSTEQKIRILREAEGSGEKIQDVCRDHQISAVRFPKQTNYLFWLMSFLLHL